MAKPAQEGQKWSGRGSGEESRSPEPDGKAEAAREQLAQNRCLGCGESGLVSLEGGCQRTSKGKLGRCIGPANKRLCFCLFAKQSLYIAPTVLKLTM